MNIISAVEKQMGVTFSDEQVAIITAFINGDNLLVSAVPGSGKSFMLIALSLAATIQKKHSWALAFNLKIVDELEKGYEKHKVDGSVYTFAAYSDLCSRSWKSYYEFDSGSKYTFIKKDTGLDFDIDVLEVILSNLPFNEDGSVSSVKVFELGKLFYGVEFDETSAEIYAQVIEEGLNRLTQSKKPYVTRVEQVAIPARFGIKQLFYLKKYGQHLKRPEVVFLDECQDMTIGHMINAGLVNPKAQIVMFGQEKQRINNFIGSHPEVVNLAIEKYDMKLMTLSTSYRCTSKICEFINQYMVADYHNNIVPLADEIDKMQAFAIGGVVKQVASFTDAIEDVKSAKSAGILTRKIKDALSLFLTCLNAGLECKLYGLDIEADIDTLAKLAKSVKCEEELWTGRLDYLRTTIKSACLAKETKFVDFDELDELLATFSIASNIATCLNMPFGNKEQVVQLIKKINTQFENAKIAIANVHKVKGAEWDLVYIHNLTAFPYRFKQQPQSDYDSEVSALYVALSRPKNTLLYSA